MSSSSENTPPASSRSPATTAKAQHRPSPTRQPLHERSKSQTNSASPTIRIVDHSDDPSIYSKSPYPTHPSQVLRPSNAFAGFVYEDQGSRVSDHQPTTNAVPPSGPSTATETLVPKPLHLRKPNRSSAASTTSDDDTVVSGSPSLAFSCSSPRFSQDTTPPLSPTLQIVDRIQSLEKVKEESPARASTVRVVIPSTSSSNPPAQQLTSRTSKASLASSESTIHYHDRSNSGSSTNLSHQPIRQAKRPLYAYPRIKKRNAVSASFRTQQSSESLTSSNKSRGSGDRPRSASAPVGSIYGEYKTTAESVAPIQYPVVRPSQASGSRAETRALPKHSSRMTDRVSGHKWSSQLSTINSESDRNSQSVTSNSGQSQSYQSRPREPTIASVTSSGYLELESSNPSNTSISYPRPLFSPHPPIEGRDSDENEDTVAELQSPPLRHQRSGYFSRFSSSDSRPSSSLSRPGTASSSHSDLVNFIANTIPAWARVYYRKGERASLTGPDNSTIASESRLNTAQSGPSMSPTEPTFPMGIYRPRNRPHHNSQVVTDSMVISEVPVERDLYVIPLHNDLREGYGSPRLHHDRRTTAHLSVFQAPSFNDSFGSLFSRGNRQILLFGIGFLFPLAWILGAILPLPPKPELSKEATPSQMDLERVMARNLGPIDELQWQKAKWWRNLNRIMSIVGVLLIGTIIALAIIAAKMMSSQS